MAIFILNKISWLASKSQNRVRSQFFFTLGATGRVTAFRTEIGQDTLSQVQANRVRIEQSTTTEGQYRRALAAFAANPEPGGTLLHWVCHDNLNYLDLTTDRLELTPA